MKKLADNECCACKHCWKDLPGALAKVRNAQNEAVCPNCGGKYWKWLNWKEWVR